MLDGGTYIRKNVTPLLYFDRPESGFPFCWDKWQIYQCESIDLSENVITFLGHTVENYEVKRIIVNISRLNLLENVCEAQCDQIGQIFKVLHGKFSYIISLNICWNFNLFWQRHYLNDKTVAATYLATFEKLGLLYIPTSDHTGLRRHPCYVISQLKNYFCLSILINQIWLDFKILI